MASIAPLSRQHPNDHLPWTVPAAAAAWFVCGVFLAVTHHVVNLHLAGQVVADYPIDQEWISRGGNALAYAVKLSLVLATTFAYVQCVWHGARGRPTRLGHFDSLFGVLDNMLEFRRLRFWFKKPVLLTVAMVVWLLPLVAIITPGSLGVTSAPTFELVNITVQTREYGSGLYAAPVVAENGSVFYGGARSYLKGPALASLVETEILSVGTFSTNLTYSLDFHGPAISCSEAPADVSERLTSLVQAYQQANATSLMYDMWIFKPTAADDNTTLADGAIVLDSDPNRNLRMLDQDSPDAAKLYFSLAPVRAQQAEMDAPVFAIQCALYNASWALAFDVRSTGHQALSPTITFENWMPGWATQQLDADSPLTNTTLDYTGLLETFGALAAGRLEVPDDPNLPFTQTSLMLETSPILFAHAAPDPFTPASMTTLTRSLEQLFVNLTLSARYAVLPAQDLRGDTPLLTRASVSALSSFQRNVYAYDQRDLLIAYALAVAGAAGCMALAVRAVRDMRAVYSNSFSTAVRVTRGVRLGLDAAMDERDKSGAEPLSRHVSDAWIWVGREPTVGMGWGRGRVGTDERFFGGGQRGRIVRADTDDVSGRPDDGGQGRPRIGRVARFAGKLWTLDKTRAQTRVGAEAQETETTIDKDLERGVVVVTVEEKRDVGSGWI